MIRVTKLRLAHQITQIAQITQKSKKQAERRGSDVQTIVNDLLKKDICLIQTVTG